MSSLRNGLLDVAGYNSAANLRYTRFVFLLELFEFLVMFLNLREQFFNLQGRIYLDAANHGPLPRTSVQAIQEALEWKKFPEHITNELYFDLPNRTRSAIAALIGSHPDEIAITTGATSGIQIVASSLGLRPEDEVVVAADEFPANYYPWDQAQQNGVRVRWARPSSEFLTAQDYIAAINERTRLVALSLVSYTNANRVDLGLLGHACRERQIPVLVDGSQAVGAFPIDVHELRIDFLVCCGYKWLLSPYGTGFFFVRRERIESLAQPPVFWQAVEGAENFNTLPRSGWRLSRGARRWDAPETASFLNLAGMEASIKWLVSVTPRRIEEYIRGLIRELIRELPGRFQLRSPRLDGCRGTFVSLAAAAPDETRFTWQRLHARGIHVSLRENALRIAPHVYNSRDDIHKLLRVLSA